MMDLDSHSCFNELVSYVALCIEYKVKRVKLDKATYNRIKEINTIRSGSTNRFMGVLFVLKD